LLISVQDDGVGLTAEEKTKLSERFYRGQRHIGKIPGSGLGLWVANTFHREQWRETRSLKSRREPGDDDTGRVPDFPVHR
jgi:signal transduction histidine kinase